MYTDAVRAASVSRAVVPVNNQSSLVASVAFSADGNLLASGGFDNVVRLWDVAQRQQVATLTGHTSYVYSVALSPGGKLLASGGGDNTVRLWDVSSFTFPNTTNDRSPDFNGDGTVDFSDFLLFAVAYGKPASKLSVAAKPGF